MKKTERQQPTMKIVNVRVWDVDEDDWVVCKTLVRDGSDVDLFGDKIKEMEV